MPGWSFRQTFDSLSVPQYRMLWIGGSFAYLAFGMAQTVRAVVAFDISGTNTAVGLVILGNGVAMLLISPLGGVIADRLPKRRLVLLGQMAVGVSFFFAGFLIVTDNITIGLLVAVTFGQGLATSVYGPARQAFVGDLVPLSKLANAVVLSQLALSLTQILGPFAAGILISLSLIGGGGTYLMMAALMRLASLTVLRLPPGQGATHDATRSIRADLMAGLHHVAGRPRLRLLVIAFIAFIMLGFPHQAVLPGLLERELGRSAEDIGLMLGVGAVAGLIASLAVATLVDGRRAWVLLLLMGAMFGLALIGLALTPSFGWALFVMIPLGAGMTGYQLASNARVMVETDRAFFGRVLSLTMLAYGSQGLTSLPVGALADEFGERVVLAVQGGLLILLMLLLAVAFTYLDRREAAEATPTGPADADPARSPRRKDRRGVAID